MVHLFITVLNMSIKASVCIIAVMLVRLCLKWSPKIFSYLLWAIVLVRLICPVALQAENFGVNTTVIDVDLHSGEPASAGNYNSPAGVQKNGEKQAAFAEPAEGTAAGIDSRAQAGHSFAEAVNADGAHLTLPERLLTVLAGIWALTAFLLIMCVGIRYISFLHRLSSKEVRTPFVAGMFHPHIYLPEGLDEMQKKLVLEHERMHIRRLDHLIKPIAFLICCIHWFNPLVWAAFFLMEKDMEASCDEAVIKKIGYDKRKDYARTLLCLAGAGGRKAGYPLAFGENDVKSRIKRVVKMKKTGIGIGIGATAAVGLAAVFLLVDAKEEEPAYTQMLKEQAVVSLPEEKVSQKAVGEVASPSPEPADEATVSDEDEATASDGDEATAPDGDGEMLPDEYVSPDMIEPDSMQEIGSDQMEGGTYLYEGQADGQDDKETIMNYDPARLRDQFEVLLLPETDDFWTDEEILFSYPVEYQRISNGFGTRTHPVTGDERFHSGIDFVADRGTSVTAAADGTVTRTGMDTMCGCYVIILHANGDATYYSFLDEVLVEEGQQVSRGEQIATVGNTGSSTGPHLHFSVSRDGKYVNPQFAEQ